MLKFYKPVVLLICSLLFIGFVQAQMTAVEIRAAYQLALESISKKDFKTAMEYIEQIKENNKTPNSGVLYLEIKVMRELNPGGDAADEKILSLINEFEKAPDYAGFSEERVLEIAKIKLSINNKKKGIDKKFDNAISKYGPFNVTIEELKLMKPDLKLNEWFVFKVADNKVIYHPPGVQFNSADYPFPKIDKGFNYFGKVSGVIVTDGKVTGYHSILRYTEDKKTDERTLLEAFYTYHENLTQGYQNAFNAVPAVSKYAVENNNAVKYLWRKNNKILQTDELDYSKGNTVFIKFIETVSVE